MSRKTLLIIALSALITATCGYGALMIRRHYLIERNILQERLVESKDAMMRLKHKNERDQLINELNQTRSALSKAESRAQRIDVSLPIKSIEEKFSNIQSGIVELRAAFTGSEKRLSPSLPPPVNEQALAILKNTTLSSTVAPDYRVREIVDRQQHLENLFLAEYVEGDYTFEDPFVIVDPYGINPLSAYVMFRTEEKCRIGLKVEGEVPVEAEFDSFGTEHRIPVLGLYENRLNHIVLSAINKGGRRYNKRISIQTEALRPSRIMNNLRIVQPNEFREFLFANGADARGFDCNGSIRHVDYQSGHVDSIDSHNGKILKMVFWGTNNALVPISSGAILETDVMGKITKAFFLPVAGHHDFIESSGNILTITHDLYTGHNNDSIIEVNKDTGIVEWDLDLKEILDENRIDVQNNYYLQYYHNDHNRDWCHLNSLWYDEKNDTLIASLRNQCTIIAIEKKRKK